MFSPGIFDSPTTILNAKPLKRNDDPHERLRSRGALVLRHDFLMRLSHKGITTPPFSQQVNLQTASLGKLGVYKKRPQAAYIRLEA